ncbi:MAG: TonB-dependent receptor [Paludibacteraceae bacterium]
MTKKVFVFIAMSLSVLLAWAQDEIKTINLAQVQVEAQKSRIYPNTSRVITIIDKADIEKLPVQNIDELLDRIAGLDIRQRGTGGVQADISIRGGSFDQVLILLNGVNITDPQTGHYNLDIPIDLNDISKIEILQGSAARIYGPNAYSGAINIVTNTENKSSLKTKNEVGSYGSTHQGICGNYFSNGFQTFASASYKQSDGYIKNTDYKIVNTFWESKINTKSAGYFLFQLSGQVKNFGANSFYTPKLPNQFESTKTLFSSVEWNLEKDFYTLNSQIYWREHFDKFIYDRYATELGANYHKTDIAGAKLRANFDWSTFGKTTVGMDIRNEHILSNNLGTLLKTPIIVPFEKDSVYYTKNDNRLLTTIMIDHNISVNHWIIAGGISSTFNKQFGTQVNGGLDASYKINNSWKMFTALNSAVRLPTFTELYYSDSYMNGNQDLKPEKSVTLELGATTNIGQLSGNVTLYRRWGNNVIDWIIMSALEKYQSKNMTTVNAIGGDINAEYIFKRSFLKSINTSYSYIDLDKKAEVYDSKYALDYLKNKIVVGLNHKICENLSAGWNISWNDRTGTYKEYTTKQKTSYKPYTLFNGKLIWNSKNIDIHFNVNNILNQQYVDYGGLKQPETNYNLGISLKI